MADKIRSPYLDYAVYLVVRLGVVVLQVMPVEYGLAFARFVGWVVYHIDKRHRQVAADNLRHAFPELDNVEIDRRIRANYAHLCSMIVEVVVLTRRMNRSNVRAYVQDADLVNCRIAWDLVRSNRPTIVMTGHLGNWEVMALALAAQGGKASVVARRLDNPFVNAYVHQLRTSTGIRLVDKQGASEEAEQILAEGSSLGLVGDQDAGSKGMFVEFFGRPASTFKSIALLSLQFQAPILVLTCVRTGEPLRHLLAMEDVIYPEDYANDPGAIRAITQRYASALERAIRRHPEQYFWLHRRWKSAPPLRRAKLAA
jgi:KDO2-lipid IV(A) lauroyltransferase